MQNKKANSATQDHKFIKRDTILNDINYKKNIYCERGIIYAKNNRKLVCV